MHIAVVSVLTRRQEARMNEIALVLLLERGGVYLGRKYAWKVCRLFKFIPNPSRLTKKRKKVGQDEIPSRALKKVVMKGCGARHQCRVR